MTTQITSLEHYKEMYQQSVDNGIGRPRLSLGLSHTRMYASGTSEILMSSGLLEARPILPIIVWTGIWQSEVIKRLSCGSLMR